MTLLAKDCVLIISQRWIKSQKKEIVLEYGLTLNFVDLKKCKIIEGLSKEHVRIG
jgi:hypothetical protein